MAIRTKARKIKTTVEGADEIIKVLNDMGLAAMDILDQAAKAGSEIALEDAKRRCPVRTGKLKAGLNLQKVNSKSKSSRSYKVSFTKDTYYGTFVEIGTKKQEAKPFLRPAVDTNQKAIAEKISAEVSAAVGRVM